MCSTCCAHGREMSKVLPPRSRSSTQTRLFTQMGVRINLSPELGKKTKSGLFLVLAHHGQLTTCQTRRSHATNMPKFMPRFVQFCSSYSSNKKRAINAQPNQVPDIHSGLIRAMFRDQDFPFSPKYPFLRHHSEASIAQWQSVSPVN